MSDRFETPRWDDEPEELAIGDDTAAQAPAGEADGSDLDASSENVLDGWPVADAVADGDEADEADGRRGRADSAARGASSAAGAIEPEADAEQRRPAAAAARRPRLGHDGACPGRADGPTGVLRARGRGSRRAPRRRRRRLPVQRRRDDTAARVGARRARGLRRRARRRHGDAGARRVRAAARRHGAREDPPVRLHRRARLRHPRRHAALRLRLERGRERPAARRASRPASRSPSACSRSTAPTRPRAASSKGAEAVRTGLEMADLFANLRAAAATLGGTRRRRRLPVLSQAACPRSAHSAGRSPASGTTGATRWSPPSAASTRTCSASG